MQEVTYAEKSTQSATYKTITYLKFVSSEVQMEKKKKYRKLIKKYWIFANHDDKPMQMDQIHLI